MLRSGKALRSRSGRALTAVIVYLICFLGLLVLVSHYYLVPALKVSTVADPQARKVMSLQALLLMTLMLFLLLLGLLITFRLGRYFKPRTTTPAKPTAYVDAWTESGRRLQTPKDEQLEE